MNRFLSGAPARPRLKPMEGTATSLRRTASNAELIVAKTRTETDTFGPIEVAADRYWGAQARALARQFQDRLGKAAAVGRARARHRQARRGGSQHGARPARPEDRRGDRRGRAGSDRRQARRPFPAGRLADRLRHAVQHERQRGDLQPRDRDARRRHGLEEAGAPQRPRQYEPVVERHLSDGHAHRLRRAHRPRPRAGAEAPARGARRQGEGIRPHHQDRPHPHAGRDAADARPGIFAAMPRRSPRRSSASS